MRWAGEGSGSLCLGKRTMGAERSFGEETRTRERRTVGGEIGFAGGVGTSGLRVCDLIVLQDLFTVMCGFDFIFD